MGQYGRYRDCYAKVKTAWNLIEEFISALAKKQPGMCTVGKQNTQASSKAIWQYIALSPGSSLVFQRCFSCSVETGEEPGSEASVAFLTVWPPRCYVHAHV